MQKRELLRRVLKNLLVREKQNLEEKIKKAKSVEISSSVVPFINEPCFYDVNKIFITRDPMRVINSLVFHGMFHINSPATAFLHDNVKNIVKNVDINYTTCSYVYSWWQFLYAEDLKIFRLEDAPITLLDNLKSCGMSLHYNDKTLPYVPATVNSSYCKQLLRPSNLHADYQAKILTMLQKLQYHERVWLPRGGHAHYVTPEWHS